MPQKTIDLLSSQLHYYVRKRPQSTVGMSASCKSEHLVDVELALDMKIMFTFQLNTVNKLNSSPLHCNFLNPTVTTQFHRCNGTFTIKAPLQS